MCKIHYITLCKEHLAKIPNYSTKHVNSVSLLISTNFYHSQNYK